MAFDAIGGDMTATMMRLMPEGSTSVVYGGLAGMVMWSTICLCSIVRLKFILLFERL